MTLLVLRVIQRGKEGIRREEEDEEKRMKIHVGEGNGRKVEKEELREMRNR